jgi:hypothetical protein
MKTLFIQCFLIASLSANAQSPVQWIFSSKKLADKMYEIHCTARIDEPWHIYAATSPADAGLPTTINFAKNPLVQAIEPVKEDGNLIKKKEENLGIELKYYKHTVDFIAVVKLKASAKTTISGHISYMACTDERCLPPSVTGFNINVH